MVAQNKNKWVKSSYSESLNCLEFFVENGANVLVRDSKNPDGHRLSVSRGAWREFVAFTRAELARRG
ncbi:DUF397 domain-containing protein [Cryptosporangium arvum]|uniref:DUF397 domain-containing protein n=1 Tax=Cryptosporangium arvum TaxID=80871 RepID=UPI0012EDE60D